MPKLTEEQKKQRLERWKALDYLPKVGEVQELIDELQDMAEGHSRGSDFSFWYGELDGYPDQDIRDRMDLDDRSISSILYDQASEDHEWMKSQIQDDFSWINRVEHWDGYANVWGGAGVIEDLQDLIEDEDTWRPTPWGTVWNKEELSRVKETFHEGALRLVDLLEIADRYRQFSKDWTEYVESEEFWESWISEKEEEDEDEEEGDDDSSGSYNRRREATMPARPKKKFNVKKGTLGGKGYVSKPWEERKRILDGAVKKYGYTGVLRKILFLENIGGIKMKLRQDHRYLMREYGGRREAPKRVSRVSRPSEKQRRLTENRRRFAALLKRATRAVSRKAR